MKSLSQKEIDQILKQLRNILDYIDTTFNRWSDYVDIHGIFVIRAELLTLWRIYEELDLKINFKSIPQMGSLDEDDFMVDDELYELEEEINKFVFPGKAVMEKKGWEEIEVYLSEDCCDYDETDEEFVNAQNEIEIEKILCQKYFGEYACILPKLVHFMKEVGSDDFWPNGSYLMKNKRAGKYLEYAEKNISIKKTKLYKQIDQCIDAIVRPYQCRYPDFDQVKIKDGCLYAFTTGGSYPSNEGEFVSTIHTKLSRYLCVEILDVLLKTAEEKYSYLKNDSL